MKKSLVLLPLAVLLMGCAQNAPASSATPAPTLPPAPTSAPGPTSAPTSAPTSVTPVGENFDITLQTTGYDASEYTYALDPVEFNAGGVSWVSSGKGSDGKGTWGGVCAKYEAAWVAAVPTGIMQFKTSTGYIENVGALSGYTKVTIKWHATYASEGTNYFPVVKCGSASASGTAVCEQTAEISGTALGAKDQKNHDVYVYTTTYVISASDAYFRVTSGAATGYIEKVSFSK